MSLPRVNAVVIGAGAGGGVVAKELREAGLRVALLERGRWYTANDCRKDDLRNQRTSVLGNNSGPDDERNPRVFVDRNSNRHIVLPSEGGYSNNAACVGAGTLTYGAMAWRYQPKDFRMRSTYGALEGSTLDDWPISYDDLAPFYEKAEYEIGVSGDVSNDPFKGPRARPLPMPPLSPTREYEILKPAARRLGLHPFDLPMLRNSVPYNGRPPCMRCRWCVGFVCEVDAKCGTHNTVIPRARPSSGAARRSRHRFRSRHRVRATSARLQKQALPQWPWQSFRLGWPQPSGARLFRRHWPVRFRHLQRRRPRRQYRHLRLQPRQSRPARRCHAGQRIHSPALPSRGHAAEWRSLGQSPQGLHAQSLSPHHQNHGTHAGNAGLRFPCATRSLGQGFLGHASGAALRLSAPAYFGNCRCHGHEGGGLAQGSRRHPNLAKCPG